MFALRARVRFDGFAWFARHAVIASFFKEIVKNSTSRKKNFACGAPGGGSAPHTPPAARSGLRPSLAAVASSTNSLCKFEHFTAT